MMERSIKQLLSKQQKVQNEKLKRCQNFAEGRDGPVPQCYRSNTPKEQLVLQNIIDLKKQLHQINQQGRDILLYPKNQCGVYKFLPTTIRPTKLGFLELYNYERCAEHIANYIAYEELDPPDQFPKIIPSPTNVSRWQKGDCFDMSILLCSLLIGVGYNAYCIYGLAPKQITTKNESLMECKLLSQGLINQQQQYIEEEEGIKQIFQKIQRRKKIISQFKHSQEQRLISHQKEILQKGMEIDDDQPDQLAPDLCLNRRIHCWVLIRKGKRDITKNIFIQPSTGRIYDTKNSPYISIYALFNNYNYWIQMRPKLQVKAVDLDDLYGMSWQFVMIDPYLFNMGDQDGQDGGVARVDKQQIKQQNKQITQFSDNVQILDMPPPWPPKIYIDKDSFIKGTPHGQTTTFFQKVKVQKYAHYSQTDGLVQKITIYQDFKKLRIKQYRYFYQHRSDKLQIVRRFPLQFKTIELYLPGKPNNWKMCIEIDRRIRIVKYYPNRNHDGLIKRVELIGEKTTQFYVNRDDRIVYRSVRYWPDRPINQGKDVSFESYHFSQKNQKGQFTKKKKVLISKICQKYQKNYKKPANQQMQKVIFDFTKQKITVIYHLDQGQIIPKVRQFYRDFITGFNKPDSSDKKADQPIVQMENQNIIELQKKCLSYIKTQQDSFDQEITNRRLQTVYLQKTLHDKARDRFKQNLNKKEEQETQKIDQNDQLRPYLEQQGLNIHKPQLTYTQALAIKQAITNKYMQRIVSRVAIIQKRINQKNQQLQIQQDLHLKKPDDKAIAQKLAQLRFKCQILDARSNRFQSMALKKFQELDTRLNNDPRLAILHKNQH